MRYGSKGRPPLFLAMTPLYPYGDFARMKNDWRDIFRSQSMRPCQYLLCRLLVIVSLRCSANAIGSICPVQRDRYGIDWMFWWLGRADKQMTFSLSLWPEYYLWPWIGWRSIIVDMNRKLTINVRSLAAKYTVCITSEKGEVEQYNVPAQRINNLSYWFV